MDKIRKTIKVYIMSLTLFITMTLVLCAVITYTSFAEEWGYVSLIGIITIIDFILGYLEAAIVGARGLLVGIISSAVFVVVILLLINLIFNEDTNSFEQHIILMVPLLAGGLGGVFGINRNK